MKIAVVAEQESEPIAKLVQAISQQKKTTAFFQNVADLGLVIRQNKPFLFPSNVLDGVDAFFFQLPSKFMPFLEPLLLELADRGVFLSIEPGSFFLLSNEPYLFHVLNRKGILIPKTMVFGEPVAVETQAKAFSFPVIVAAYSGPQRIQSVLCKKPVMLKGIVNSLPPALDCLLVQEHPLANKIATVVIGDQLFSAEFSFDASRGVHQKKGRSIRLNESDSANVLRASRTAGLQIAYVETLGNKVSLVSPLIDWTKMEQSVGEDLYARTARFLVENAKEDWS